MDLITCQACGRQVAAQSRFCQYCGSSLTVQQASGPPPSGSPAQPSATQSTREQTAPNNAPLPIGTRLRDRYIIEHPLGQGGFGRTYRAQDTGRFNEPIVLKELTPTVQGTAALEKAAELFEREAATLHRLQHNQIPRFWEIFQSQKRLFLVEDFIPGPTYQSMLAERQTQNQTFSEPEIFQLFRHLLPVLDYLHGKGVIHRDISPDNIIYRERDGLPVLIDLGGVKQMAMDVATEMVNPNQAANTSGTRLGKVGYAPDEQMRLGLVAPHSDLYALAVTALVLMTGKHPQQLQDPHTLAWTWQQELSLSPQFSQLLHTMVSARPLDRFQSAQEVLQALSAQEMGTAEIPATVAGVPPTAVGPISDRQDYAAAAAMDGGSVANGGGSPVDWPNTSGQGALAAVPPEIKGWNWGAFLLPGVWFLTNAVWVGALSWVGGWFIMGPILGLNGNHWAWRARQWPSVAAFKRHQRNWAIIGITTIGGLGLLLMLLIAAVINDETAPEPISSSDSTQTELPDTSESASGFQPLPIPALERFRAPTGVFTIEAPKGWVRLNRSKSGEALFFWNHISGTGNVIADVFDVPSEPTSEVLSDELIDYLKKTYGKEPDFSIEEEARPQDDGSLLHVFTYTNTIRNNKTYKVLGNSFIKNEGRRVAVLTLLIPNQQLSKLKPTLDEMINSFEIDTEAALPK